MWWERGKGQGFHAEKRIFPKVTWKDLPKLTQMPSPSSEVMQCYLRGVGPLGKCAEENLGREQSTFRWHDGMMKTNT